LKSRLETNCDYEYQGSVTNDTHIKARSDIDILLLIGKFITIEVPQVPNYPYSGDPIQDLLELRADAIKILKEAFPLASVDTSGSKSISISGGSLSRKIDVVPSNWFNSNTYAEKKQKIYRGVQILDSKNKRRLKNTPFLHNEMIDIKDSNTNGGLRKASRLLKSLKYDTETIEMSSYDLVSIAFRIPDGNLNVSREMELTILNTCLDFCRELQSNIQKRQSLYVPDGHRKIFTQGHATIEGLNQLTASLDELVQDVLVENRRSFKKLAEARISY